MIYILTIVLAMHGELYHGQTEVADCEATTVAQTIAASFDAAGIKHDDGVQALISCELEMDL